MPDPITEIAVIGCGVVGLPFAVALATRGYRVIGIDVAADRIRDLRDARVSEREADLKRSLQEGLTSGALRFDTTLAPAKQPRGYVIVVPTPADTEGQVDEEPLAHAVATLAKVTRDGDLVMVRSTVPVRTTRRIATRLNRDGQEVFVAATPDRSLTGRSFADQFCIPHVVGGCTPAAAERAATVLQALGRVIDAGNAETAEAIKLFDNVHRDVTFALANELAMLSEALDVDFHRIRQIGGMDYPRFSVARPGPVGGPCLTKDVHLLAASLEPTQATPMLGLTGRRVNTAVVEHIVAVAERIIDGTDARSATVAVLGLAFKGFPVTIEQRGSFTHAFLNEMKARCPEVTCRTWDPEGDPTIPVADAVRDCTVVVIATEHEVLRTIDVGLLAARMRSPGMIIDMWGDQRAVPVMPHGIGYHAFGAGRPVLATT